MGSLSITLQYRPVRIGWCVEKGDFTAFRQAARRSFSLWGGRYNPIIPIDDPAEAKSLIDLFRVDCLYPASDSEAVKAFIEAQGHLPWPDYQRSFVVGRGRSEKVSTFADLVTPVRFLHDEHFRNNPQAPPLVTLYEWSDEDPLADVLLATFGALPPAEEAAHDYAGILRQFLHARPSIISPDQPIYMPDPGQRSLASFNRFKITQHYKFNSNLNHAGFYIGNASDFDDIVSYWNLRAADIPLMFYDPAHAERMDHSRGQWLERVPRDNSPARQRGIALWSRQDITFSEKYNWAGGHRLICSVDPEIWNGLNLKAPFMVFGSENVLASLDHDVEPPTMSFSIPNSPLRDDGGLTNQQFVVSIDPGIGLFENERFTLHLPFLPKLNEFYGREATFHWNKTRSEPGSLGVVVPAATHDLRIRAIETRQLFERIFASVGIKASPSPAGLVCTRLIRQMGGIDRCRAFLIGGVRDLIEKYPPEKSFTTSAAKQTIRAQETDHPLSNYQNLYIEPRPPGTPLTNDAVLVHLLKKGVFRPGLRLECPNCQLDFWISLDDVKTNADCEYCGGVFHVGPQLRDRDWAYRRSGLFGRNDNQEGAIPVILALLQLARLYGPNSYALTTATSLLPIDADIPKCETDFIFMVTGNRGHRVQIVIGECKTRQPISQDDVQNLLKVAKAFPEDRFDVYLVFSKLADFSEEELSLIAGVNNGPLCAIVLTQRELDRWHPYEAAVKEFGIDPTIVDLEGMALATFEIYLKEVVKNKAQNG